MRLEILDSCPLVYVIHDFLLPQECKSYIALAERLNFKPAPLTTASGPVMNTDVRSNTRVMLDDVGQAEGLWQRARPLVPPLALDHRDEERRPIGLNERLRFFRYDPGQRFAPHYDGAFQRNYDEGSMMSFMVYLNDDFEGGETRFFTDMQRPRMAVKPRTGMALVFVHNQLHEGASVKMGRKYVLRSDVMYSRVVRQTVGVR